MSAGIDELDQIRRRMALVRRDLSSEIQATITEGELLPDWRWYVRKYPGMFLTAAVMAGYLIVPRRGDRGAPAATTEPFLESFEESTAAEAPARQPPDTFHRVLINVWDIVYPVAIRAAQGYAVHRVEQWLRQLSSQKAPAPPSMEVSCSHGNVDQHGPEVRSSLP